MGLFEFERREVVGQRIIGCVFEICCLRSARDARRNWKTSGFFLFYQGESRLQFLGSTFSGEGVEGLVLKKSMRKFLSTALFIIVTSF